MLPKSAREYFPIFKILARTESPFAGLFWVVLPYTFS